MSVCVCAPSPKFICDSSNTESESAHGAEGGSGCAAGILSVQACEPVPHSVPVLASNVAPVCNSATPPDATMGSEQDSLIEMVIDRLPASRVGKEEIAIVAQASCLPLERSRACTWLWILNTSWLFEDKDHNDNYDGGAIQYKNDKDDSCALTPGHVSEHSLIG